MSDEPARLEERPGTETEQADLVDQLRSRIEELTTAVATRDLVLATVTHEMRNPLSAIVGFTSLLRRRLEDLDDSSRVAVDAIERQAKQLDRLVGDLLSLAVVEGGNARLEPRPVVLRSVIDQVVDDAGLAGEVTTDVPDDLLVHADTDRLAQMLGNLLTNAGRHGAPPVTVSARVEGAWVEVRVQDRGPGVPDDLAPRLFQAFAIADGSTPRAARGTGLGLAIVRALARAHGGDAWYDADRAPGACFVLGLPAVTN